MWEQAFIYVCINMCCVSVLIYITVWIYTCFCVSMMVIHYSTNFTNSPLTSCSLKNRLWCYQDNLQWFLVFNLPPVSCRTYILTICFVIIFFHFPIIFISILTNPKSSTKYESKFGINITKILAVILTYN